MEPIPIRKISYDKPIAVIINPTAGKSKNIVDKIKNALKGKIDLEFFCTERSMHAYELA